MSKKIKKIKTDIEIYQAYQKSNTLRKLYLADKAGYSDIEEYRTILFNKANNLPVKASAVAKPKVVKKTNTKSVVNINNVYLLDNSGSMRGRKFDNAVKAIKEEISELKDVTNVNYFQSFACFNSVNSAPLILDIRTPIGEFEYDDSIRANCMTPLYSTIIELLNRLKKETLPGDKVLVKIFTDGGNNHGTYSTHEVSNLIKECEDLGYTITFIGTPRDVKNCIDDLGIDKSNTITHDNTAKGIAKVMETTTKATRAYTKKVVAGEDVSKGFYSKSNKLF